MLPPIPQLEIELVDEVSTERPGFLRLIRQKLRLRYPDGRTSEEFAYDAIDRSALDSVVIVAHFIRERQRRVYLRSAVRPALRLHAREPNPGSLWELPAGLVEVHEQGPAGLLSCAARELREELGFDVSEERFAALGVGVFPAPGVIAERQFFFELEVRPEQRGEPRLDGSALEARGRVIEVPLEDALQWCREGYILDAKTELGLRRLAERWQDHE